MQLAVELRVSTEPRLGTLPDVAFDLPVQRKAAGAAVCDEESLRWCQPVELPVVLQPGLALFGSSGGRQRPRRPPSGLEGSLLVPWVGMGPKVATVEVFIEHHYVNETALL